MFCFTYLTFAMMKTCLLVNWPPDPGLYTRVYSACHHNQCLKNYNDGPQRTHTEHSAEQTLQQLGINTIKSIAVTATVQQFFSRTSLDRTEFLKQHWQHSLYCASVARSIAKLSCISRSSRNRISTASFSFRTPTVSFFSSLVFRFWRLVVIGVLRT